MITLNTALLMMVEVSNSSQQKGKNFTTNLLLNVLLQVLIQQPPQLQQSNFTTNSLLNVLLQVLIQQPPQLQQSPQLAQIELVSDGANIHIAT